MRITIDTEMKSDEWTLFRISEGHHQTVLVKER
jgi:hypothetical protein